MNVIVGVGEDCVRVGVNVKGMGVAIAAAVIATAVGMYSGG